MSRRKQTRAFPPIGWSRHLALWEIIRRVRRGGLLSLIVVVSVAVAVGQADATTGWPSRSGPVSSTLGWFKAINAHDRKHLLYYVAPSARAQMGWAQPSHAWPKFTHLRCRRRKVRSTNADIRCTFHESGPPAVVGNPDTLWDVYLHAKRGVWLISGYGQG